MKSILLRVFLFGILLGIISSISTMVLGLIIYFAVTAIDLYLPSSFLKHTALISLAVGTLCTLSSYVYVGILVKQFIKQAVHLGGKP